MIRRFLAIAMMFICAGAFAQEDLSGAWNFNKQESVSGNLYSNGSPKAIRITQHKEDMMIEMTTAGQDADVTVTDTLSFTGKPYERITKKSKRKVVVTNKWSDDKKSITLVETIYSASDNSKEDFKTTDVYSIEDGKLLLDRKTENFMNGETWESKAWYDKQ